MNKKEEFIAIAKENIKREGIEKLLDYLENTNFYSSPASTKFHSAYEGGLCAHSINVFNRLLSLVKSHFGENFENNISRESIAIIGLFHDICKVDIYKTEMRNVKVDGNWVQQPFYKTEDDLPYGHGEKSVYMLGGFLKLTREEAMSINWHMGGFDMRVKAGSYAIADAFYKWPVAFLTHIADMQATYLDETRD